MNRRNAFTLVETLITLTLAAFLMAVVWGMLDIYTKLEDKGVRAAQRAAVVRAVKRQLRNDLMQLSPVDAARLSPTQENGASHDPYPSNGYFFGTGTELHFVTFKESGQETLRAISYAPQTPAPEDNSEPKADGEFKEALTGVMRVDRSWGAFQSGRLAESNDLSRFTAGREIQLDQDDFLFIGDQAKNANRESFPSAPEIRDEIPEIAAWNFRYFDNGKWHDRWDSGWHRRPPAAVEVSFNLNGTSSADDENDLLRDSQQPAFEHRFTISIGINSSISTRGVQR